MSNTVRLHNCCSYCCCSYCCCFVVVVVLVAVVFAEWATAQLTCQMSHHRHNKNVITCKTILKIYVKDENLTILTIKNIEMTVNIIFMALLHSEL